MTDALALLAIAALGYFAILDNEPSEWTHERALAWLGFVRARGFASPMLAWPLAVAAPALLVALVGLVRNDALNFVFDTLILLLTTAATTFITSHRQLVQAVYANDVERAATIANDWEQRGDEVVDSEDKFAVRMLELCATRLHHDVLAVVLWFLLLGPAGALLIFLHHRFMRQWDSQLTPFRFINAISASATILTFGVIGNMRPALSCLRRFDVARAALAAGGIDESKINIERVPDFGSFLLNSYLLGFGAAAFYLLSVFAF